jgi:hypothetical protein
LTPTRCSPEVRPENNLGFFENDEEFCKKVTKRIAHHGSQYILQQRVHSHQQLVPFKQALLTVLSSIVYWLQDAAKDLLLQLDNVQFIKFLDAQQPLPDQSITYRPPDQSSSTACVHMLLHDFLC